MQQKVTKAILAGVVGTIVMTIITFLAPLMGMPKMSPPEMLAGMMGFPILVGWIMHFMIGIIFALAYVFVISGLLANITSPVLKGVVFGIIAFVIAQISIKVMTLILGGMSAPADNMFLMIIGSMIGHVMYGIAVALVAKEVAVVVTSENK